MRIIAGTKKGATIFAPPGSDTRPTADKVRGAIFNILVDVSGKMVLDLFAGSGALGLEALSRGASAALLVDNRPAAIKTISRNIAKLKLENVRLVRRDFAALLKEQAKKPERFDLIFVDPPYRMHRVIEPKIRELVPPLLAPGGQVVVESSVKQELSLPWRLQTEKVYGDTKVSIFSAGDAAASVDL